MANPKTSVVITAEDRASRVIRNVREELLGMSSLGSRLASVASPLGGIAAGVAALGGGILVLRNFVSAIDDLSDTAEGLGTTAVALSEMRSKAAEAGVEAGTLDNAIGKLNNKIGDAVAGNQKAVALFEAMGVAFRDTAGNARPTEQVLADIADRMRTYANTAEKAALVSELFGEKIGRKLVAYLNQGSDGLRQFTGLTDDTIKEAAQLQTEIDKLANSWERLKNSVLGAAVPAINTLIEAFRGGSTEQRISEVERIIRSMEHAAVGSVKNLEMYREELKRLKAELSDESMGRFLSGAQAARRVDAPVLAPRLVDEKDKRDKLNKTITETSNAYAKEFADIARIRVNRAALAAEIEREDAALQAEADQRRIEVLDRLAELEGALTSKQKERIATFIKLREAGDLNEAGYVRLMEDLLGKTEAVVAETAKLNDVAKDFGFTFSSAFEDIIVNGGDARDVIKSLEQDIIRMTTRLLVTQPMGNAISGMFSRGGATMAGGGDIFDAFADSFIKLFGMSSGGPVMGGYPYLVGEKGPELFVPKQSGQIVPGGAPMGRSMVINVNVPSNTSGATAQQIAATVARTLAIADARLN